MNKKEAIEKLEQEATRTKFTEIDIEVAIKVIEELDEPEQEKVMVTEDMFWEYMSEQYYFDKESFFEKLKEYNYLKKHSIVEKPVIPQFVANEIERYDNMLDMLSGEYFNSSFEEIDDDGLLIWIDENQETFARAWLDGFLIEEEKLYRVVLNHKQILWQATDGSGDIDIISRIRITTGKTKFTEQEIKNIDERYWAFAEEVPD